jgi:hypothetical protein
MNAAASCSIPVAAPSRARHKPHEMPERGSGPRTELGRAPAPVVGGSEVAGGWLSGGPRWSSGAR